MPILHDLRCQHCGRVEPDVGVVEGDYGSCACGGPRVPDWSHGKAPATDLRAPAYNHATGQVHTSQRQADQAMRDMGRRMSERIGMKWDPISAGDKVHGARDDLNPRSSAWSYKGQGARTSTGERGARGRGSGPPRSAPPPPPADAKMRPRSVSRAEIQRIKRSPVWPG